MRRHAFRNPVRIQPLLWALVALSPATTADVQPQVEIPIACDEGAEPIQLVYGSHTTGCTISPNVDIDLFVFDGEAGDLVRIAVHGRSNFFDPRCEVFAPSGFLLEDSCGNGPCTFVMEFTLPETGEYTLILSDSGSNETGSYTIQLEALPYSVSPSVVGYDQPASEAINPTTDHDFYRFYGEAGSLMRIGVNGFSNFFDPRFELYDPTGALAETQLCSNGPCSITFDYSVPFTGWYVLVFSDSGVNETGSYNLSINCLVGCPQRVNTTVSNGSGVNDTCYSTTCPPHIGGVWEAEVDTSGHSGATLTVVFGYSAGSPPIQTNFGELLVNLRSTLLLSSTEAPVDDVAVHSFPVPDNPVLAGLPVFTQAVVLGGEDPEFCNAIDVVLGF